MTYETNDKKFRSSIERLFFYQSEILSSSGDKIKYLEQRLKSDSMVFQESYYYLSEESGKKKYFGSRKYDKNQFFTELLLIRNRQYQWMLVEAFEEFKIYIEEQSSLICESAKVSSKVRDEFKKKIENQRDSPSCLLNSMRSYLEGFSRSESRYGSDLNLRFAYTLVRVLREYIVHKRGLVVSVEEFTNRVIKDSGISEREGDLTNHIRSFFGNGIYENTILLIEKPAIGAVNIGAYVNDFKVLSGYLLNYSDFLMKFLMDNEYIEESA